jgi:hypothetical protein
MVLEELYAFGRNGIGGGIVTPPGKLAFSPSQFRAGTISIRLMLSS